MLGEEPIKVEIELKDEDIEEKIEEEIEEVIEEVDEIIEEKKCSKCIIDGLKMFADLLKRNKKLIVGILTPLITTLIFVKSKSNNGNNGNNGDNGKGKGPK